MKSLRCMFWLTVMTAGPDALLAQPEQEEAPERGVARISLIQGDVSVRRGDSNEVIAAAVNAPVVIQDRVLTSYSSRAELQFDFANYLRMAADTDLRLVELEYRRFMIQLARGTVQWRMNQDNAADVDISTPSISVRPVRWGDYRVTVRDDGTTEITVRRGEAEIYSPRGVQRLSEGRTMLARGNQSEPEFQLIGEIPEDDFDRWNRRRDAEFERSTSRRYLPQGMTGWEELDAHGGWVDVAPYGRVWRPRVAVGWSPYRHGRWTWLDWYGWTWVSYDPFGWAPFHYGRWFNYAGGWHWWPGTIGPRVWWRPAIVSWFGWGGVNVSIGFGRCWGWVPLAPFEPFHPWYGRGLYRGWGRGFGYGGNVTIVNNYNIINNYRNARIQGAVHGIPADQFGRGGYRGGEYLRASEANLREASLVRGELPASPDRGALAYSDRRVNDSAGVRGVANYDRGFYARRSVETAERVPFDQQRQGLERSAELSGVRGGGGSSGGNGFPPVRESAPAVRDGALAGRENSGWRRFGEPSGSGVAPGVQPSNGEASHGFRGESGIRGGGGAGQSSGQRGEESRSGSGWRRFGEPSGSDAVRGGSSRRGESGSPSYSQPSDSQPSYSRPESNPSYRQPSYRTGSESRRQETRQPDSRQSDSFYRRSEPSGGSGSGSGARGGGSYAGSYGSGSGARGSSPSDGGGYRGGSSGGSGGGGGMRGGGGGMRGGGGGGASPSGGGSAGGGSTRGGGSGGGGGSRGGSGGGRNQ